MKVFVYDTRQGYCRERGAVDEAPSLDHHAGAALRRGTKRLPGEILLPVKLYVCCNASPGPGGLHPCGKALLALRDAGYQPDVVKSRGFGFLPDRLNRTEGRRAAKRLTGSTIVPVLVSDAGEVVSDSKRIVAWVPHPAAQA